MARPRPYIVREINRDGAPVAPGPGVFSFETQGEAERFAQRKAESRTARNGTGEWVVFKACAKFAPPEQPRFREERYGC